MAGGVVARGWETWEEAWEAWEVAEVWASGMGAVWRPGEGHWVRPKRLQASWGAEGMAEFWSRSLCRVRGSDVAGGGNETWRGRGSVGGPPTGARGSSHVRVEWGWGAPV